MLGAGIGTNIAAARSPGDSVLGAVLSYDTEYTVAADGGARSRTRTVPTLDVSARPWHRCSAVTIQRRRPS